MAKILLYQGCRSYAFEIDGKSIYDMKKDDVLSILQIVIQKLIEEDEDINANSILQTIIESYGEYKTFERCDQCGDSVTEITFEI